jgi:hypothetical protein
MNFQIGAPLRRWFPTLLKIRISLEALKTPRPRIYPEPLRLAFLEDE